MHTALKSSDKKWQVGCAPSEQDKPHFSHNIQNPNCEKAFKVAFAHLNLPVEKASVLRYFPIKHKKL